jgi:hypothetical protein
MLFVAVRGRSWLFVAAHCWQRPFRVVTAPSTGKGSSSISKVARYEKYLEI